MTTRPSVPDRIAGAPISRGVCEVPGWGHQLDPEAVLWPSQMREVGIAAPEFCPDGVLPESPADKGVTLAGVDIAMIVTPRGV